MSKHSIVFFLLLIYFIIDSVIKSCPRFPRLHFQQWTCLRCSNKNHFRFGETVILNLTKKELVKGARNNKYISLFTSNRKNKPLVLLLIFLSSLQRILDSDPSFPLRQRRTVTFFENRLRKFLFLENTTTIILKIYRDL